MLRHSSASPRLQAGDDIRTVRALPGYRDVKAAMLRPQSR